jgi:hypothetical protein
MTKTPVSRKTSRPKASPAKRGRAAPKSQTKAKAKAAPRKVSSRRATSRKPTAAPREHTPAAVERSVRTSSIARAAAPIAAAENTSGRGKDAVVPPEIMEWSWGAFILNWIWAISHRVWIGLLTLVPGIGLFVAAYLGSKGNELAWRHKRWDSVDAFRTTQRRWRNAALIYLAATMALFVASVALTMTLGSDPSAPVTAADGRSEGRTMKSETGAVSVTVPSSWRGELALNEEADIQASDVATESYVAVFVEPKSDFPADTTIIEYTQVSRGNVLASLTGGSQPQAATRLKVNGMPAIRSHLVGAIEGEQVAYLHTVIETPTRYVQVVTWTLRSNWEQNRETLNRIAGSFVEAKPA